MRPRQWVKNILVFAVPLAAGEILHLSILWPTIAAFIAFCLASSATYLVNDVRDAEADRAHPTKHTRPIAAGDLGRGTAVAAAFSLGLLALIVAAATSWPLFWVLVAYVATTTSYSLALKHEPVIELALLSLGFLLRAIAGGAASGLPISQWFLIVAGFGSLFMAAGKRFSELTRVTEFADADPTRVRRKSLAGYTPSYLRFVWATAAAVTVTAYCLWAFEVGAAQSVAPWAALSIIPFVLAILRYAVDIDRASAEAPEDVVLKDRVLLVLGLLWLVLFSLGALGV